ncbi:hypothetical protein Cgig2_028608 [Carnegiea gigantea]|uniref:Transposase-associated domain-containing protein n=1 Tax=Carnegiea gigantea TaxID=171969 RepID=A0A9Q1QEH0_9CARY|nr:hypothetical protein Cgig2_028608 [Carnegiea gigantea]
MTIVMKNTSYILYFLNLKKTYESPRAFSSAVPTHLHQFPLLLLSTLIASSRLLSSKEDEPNLKLKLRKGFRWAIVRFVAGTVAQDFRWAIVRFAATGIQGRRVVKMVKDPRGATIIWRSVLRTVTPAFLVTLRVINTTVTNLKESNLFFQYWKWKYDMSTNKEWMKLKNRSTSQYLQGVDKFLEFAFSVAFPNENMQIERRTIRCPYNNCPNVYFKIRRDARYDLLKNDILQSYTIWDKHGEYMDNFHANNEVEVNENLDYEDMLDILQVATGVIGTGLIGNEERNVHGLSETTEEPTAEAAQEHKEKLATKNPRNVERRHKVEFSSWVHNRVEELCRQGSVNANLYYLVCKPLQTIRCYSGYIVNGMVGRGQGKNTCRNAEGGRSVSVQNELQFLGKGMNKMGSVGLDIDIGSNTHSPIEEEVQNDNLVRGEKRKYPSKFPRRAEAVLTAHEAADATRKADANGLDNNQNQRVTAKYMHAKRQRIQSEPNDANSSQGNKLDIDIGSNTHSSIEEEVRNDSLVPSPPRDQQDKCP